MSNVANQTVAENAVFTGTTPSVTGALGDITYSLSGTDAGDFTIDSSTGVVSMVVRDFEAPADANTDNVYSINVVATDANANTTSEAITVTVTNVNDTPPALPANISITDDSLDSYVISIFDTDYNVDITGVINNSTKQITIDIPYTVTGGGSVNLDAYSITANLSSTHSEDTEDSVVLTFSYQAQTGLSGTGTFTGTITVDDTNGINDDTFNTKELDIDDDNNITLATFDYATDDAGGTGTYTITVLNGVKDRMYGVSDNASNTESHKFIYIPLISPDTGKAWLNNNLGAEYADATNPNGNLNVEQQATVISDYKAYGSLFQWGRKADGHELLTRTAATDAGTVAANGTNPTNSDDPSHAQFITEPSSPYDWRVSQDDTLWASESSANNVCPVGWRIPTEVELTAETTGAVTNPVTNNSTVLTNFLKLTTAGFLDGSTGAGSHVGSLGFYWTSDVSGSSARYLGTNSGNADFSTGSKVLGFSVRCVKD